MGTKSDYVAGTITVTQGSVDFTGTDTLWRVMGFQEGDTVLLKGYQMVIDAGNVGSGLETQLITSNTSGKFTEAWPGESGTFPYRMRWQSNDSRLSAKVSDFLLRTASGNITAIGELEGIENTLIRFTGPGTVELIDQSEVGIQDPNGNLAELAALTLAANKILNTDASSELTQSDITAAALVLLKLAGTAVADKLPFFDGADSAALTGFTAFARSILDDETGAAMWATMGGTGSSSAIKLPDGTMLQRGTNALPTVGYGTIPFPTAFPENCFGVVASITENAGAAYTYTITAGSITRNSFYGTGHTLQPGSLVLAPVSFQWIAWGN